MDMPPCPFCNAPFGWARGSHVQGCTNNDCAEHPVIHDPVGDPVMVESFWEVVIELAPEKKKRKREWLEEQIIIVEKYYQDS